jgi:dihydrofolate synthase/folylpolyglutamate synthase
VLAHAQAVQAPAFVLGRDFQAQSAGCRWRWSFDDTEFDDLPLPALAGEHQIDNAATAMMAIHCLNDALTLEHVCTGLRSTRLPGRFQVVSEGPDIIVDVAHNPHAARVLASALSQRVCRGRTVALVAMFKDKDIADSVRAMVDQVDEWYVAALDSPRGSTVSEVAARLEEMPQASVVYLFDSVAAAFAEALPRLERDDRLIAFGSHTTVAEVVRLAS